MTHAIIIICLLSLAGVFAVLGYVCGVAEGVERGKRLPRAMCGGQKEKL